MFTVECPVHGATVLIWPSNVDGASNINGVIVIDFHCSCGWAGSLVTGRGVERAVTLARSAPAARTSENVATGPPPNESVTPTGASSVRARGT